MSLIKVFSIFSLVLCLQGCVGTIEEKEVETTKNAEFNKNLKFYKGLLEAKAVSDDKVELKFVPANGNNEDLTYFIHVNDTEVPIQVSATSLPIDVSGNHLYTVKYLEINTEYSFRISVLNSRRNEKLELSDPLFTKTYSNKTADFDGVTSAEALKGIDGKNSILVSWTPGSYTGASPFFPDTGDIIAYRITYLPAKEGIKNLLDDNYTSSSKVSTVNPASLGSNPFRSTETSRVITGLLPDTEYLFRVNAIHKGYVDYSESASYKVETNSRVVKGKTLSETGVYDFDSSTFELITPNGDKSLSSFNSAWDSATGEFYGYRIYTVQVSDENQPDALTSAGIDTLNLTTSYINVDASKTYAEITGLLPYEWYQVKLVVCRTVVCGNGERILSNLVTKQTIPKIAPFSGIISLENPTDTGDLTKINMKFNAPVTSVGFLNDFEIYCYESRNDSSPVRVPVGAAVSGSGKANCEGVQRLTTTPSTFTAFSNFKAAELNGITVDSEVCFSAIPVINGLNGFLHRDIDNASVKCFVPEIKTPSVEEFAGKSSTCTVSATDLTVNWTLPNGGIYTNFEVYWKESDGSGFKFSDAIAAAPGYSKADGIGNTDVQYTINNLMPGKSYHTAVLAYLDDGTRYYSEFNPAVNACYIPLPTAEFNEWVDIFAIGPKENGLIPRNPFGESTFIVETLDNDNVGAIPIEVNMDAADPTGEAIDSNFSLTRNSSGTFNGIFGSLNADETKSLNQYSNSGIIKISWKDVNFFSGAARMNDLISTFESGSPLKKDQVYGYKVYRSEDNKLTWSELTSNSNAFQTVLNSGPVRASNQNFKARNNDSSTTYSLVSFTDYSVKHSDSVGSVDRARIYYYKVVPVFNGMELKFNNETKGQNIIRVTLPPKNMALVHRMMANRSMCLELGKSLNKEEDEYYSCDYDGLGASSLTGNGLVGSTVYDLGSDLLVDRFELGCNFTRGDPSVTYSGPIKDFTNTGFTGCTAPAGSQMESAPFNVATDYTKVVSGDCFGTDFVSTTRSVCSSDANSPRDRYSFPGAMGGTPNCTNSINTIDGYPIEDRQPQSEYAAVYYTRDVGRKLGRYKGPDGGDLNSTLGRYASGCYINLYSVDNADGKITARWLPSNDLFNDRIRNSVTSDTTTLIDKKLSEVLTDNKIYNTTDVSAPALDLSTNVRISLDDKVGRILSSNSAKLPPLRNLAQEDLSDLCGLYEVEVGFEKNGVFYQSEAPSEKRIISRKEQVIASKWPDVEAYDETFITSLEDGSISSSYLGGAGGDSDGCNSGSRLSLDGDANVSTSDTIPTLFPQVLGTSTAYTFITGSSSFDGNGRNNNSQRCVSKFGIQDLVGNVAEYTSDQIFCDFSGEQLFLGVSGDVTSSIPYDGPFRESYRYVNDLLTAWVDSAPTTGSCSTVEVGGVRTGAFTVGSLFNDIYDENGQADNLVVSRPKSFHQDSVLDVRNGDGFFLDFGQNNLGPPLSLGNTLSLSMDGITEDNRRAKFFNPALGMPLECLNGTCDNSVDNLAYATQAQIDNVGLSLNPVDYTISNFPVNNSQIFNNGIREISRHTRLSSPNSYGGQFNYINSISPTDSFTIDATHPTTNIEYLSADGVVDTVDATNIDWKVGRDQAMYMIYGGRANSDFNGRYSFIMEGNQRNHQSNWRTRDSSGRCVVKINRD